MKGFSSLIVGVTDRKRLEYFDDWDKSYGTMCEKYEKNGYVLPKIVHCEWLYYYLRVSVVGTVLIKLVGSS